MTHTLPKLGYSYDSLEPEIDAKAMEIHHTKHHQTYVDKLNAALDKHPELKAKKVEELLNDLNTVPEDIRGAVRNHGGGHVNHSLWWNILKKNVKLSGDVEKEINQKFGNYEEFKKKFSESALGLFGSGWTWLVWGGKEVEILNTPNQDSPLSQGKTPLLGVDVWEHAYYLKYQSKRADFVNAFFNVINWDFVNANLKSARNGAK